MSFRALHDRHDMYQIDSQFLKISGFFRHPRQIAGKAVAIQGHTRPALIEKPVVLFFPQHIFFPQGGAAVDILPGHGSDQLRHALFKIITLPI